MYSQLLPQIAVMVRFKWAPSTIRKQHSLLIIGYTNSLVYQLLEECPAIFYLVIDIILSSVKRQLAPIYPDDIVVVSRSPLEDINDSRLVLSDYKEAGVTLKLRKCPFFTSKICHFRNVNRSGRLEVTKHTADNIRSLSIQTTETTLRSISG